MQVFAVLLLAGLAAAAIPLDRRAFYVYDDAHYHRLGDFSGLPLSKYSINKPVVTVAEDDLSTIYVDRALRDYPTYRQYINIPEDFALQYDDVLASPLSEKVLSAPVHEKFIDAPWSKSVLAAPLSEKVLAAPLSAKVLSAPAYEKYIDASWFKNSPRCVFPMPCARTIAAPLSERVLAAPVFEKFIDAPLSKRVLAAPLSEKVLAVPSYEKVYSQKGFFAPAGELVDYPEKRYSTILEKSVPTAFYTLA